MRCDEMDAAAAQHVEREWKLTAILLGDDLSLLPDLTLPYALFQLRSSRHFRLDASGCEVGYAM